MTDDRIQCKLSQRDRVLRVFVLARLYCDFRDIYLNECSLNHSNNYKSAENTSDMMNIIFNQDTTPTDFIIDKEKITNDLIDKSVNFNKNLKELKGNYIGLNEKIVRAFCKNVEHGNFHLLKINNSFVYQTNWLLDYVLNIIGKDTFLEGFKEINIFSKSRKYNNLKYKRTFLAIEKTYYEIVRKQIYRNLKLNEK